MVALEADVAHLVLAAFVDHEDQIRRARLARGLRAVGDGGVRVAAVLIVFFDVAAGFEDLRIAHRAACLDLRFLRQFLVGESRVADKPDTAESCARRHLCDQLYTAIDGLGEETHVIYQAGLVKRLDVVVQTLCTVKGAGLGAHQVAQAVFVDCLGSLIADDHFRDGLTLEILSVQRARERNNGKGSESGKLAHTARHEE